MKVKRGVRAGARRQRGAVAVITGLTIAVMIAFLGISVDLGRLFVMKAELQTAMDACALAAASGLRPGANDARALERAKAYGRTPVDPSRTSTTGASRGSSVDQVDFQGMDLDPNKILFAFGSRLDNVSGSWTEHDSARYARCSYPLEGRAVYFMRVIGGATTASVGATATATLKEAAGPACVFPIAVCNMNGNKNAADRWGLTPGQWQRSIEKKGDTFGPGQFGWLDLDGGSNSAAVLKAQISGDGYCGEISEELKPGATQGVQDHWNTRFGLYKGALTKDDAQPDFSGYSYRDVSAPSGKVADNWAPLNWESTPALVINAYSGTDQNSVGGLAEGNYKATSGAANQSFQYGKPAWSGSLSAEDLRKYGRSRRVVPVPVYDCPAPGTASPSMISGAFACVLLLHPISEPKNATVEFLGRADEIADCATAGAAGGAPGSGPLVPVLVQ